MPLFLNTATQESYEAMQYNLVPMIDDNGHRYYAGTMDLFAFVDENPEGESLGYLMTLQAKGDYVACIDTPRCSLRVGVGCWVIKLAQDLFDVMKPADFLKTHDIISQ